MDKKYPWEEIDKLLFKVRPAVLAEKFGVPVARIKNRKVWLNKKRRPTTLAPEYRLQKKFVLTLKGEYAEYVKTPGGTIDVMTPTHIYEVKANLYPNSVRTSVCQLLFYGLLYPDKKLVLVTNKLREMNSRWKNAITRDLALSFAKKYGVEVVEL